MRASLFLVIIMVCFSSFGQKLSLSSDHYAILVSDLDQSVAFYHELLGIKEINNGTEKENIRWLALNNGFELHLIEKDNTHIKLTKDIHLSFSSTSLDEVISYFRINNIKFETWLGKKNRDNIRPDGVRQIYLQDPDGYWIEINDAK